MAKEKNPHTGNMADGNSYSMSGPGGEGKEPNYDMNGKKTTEGGGMPAPMANC